MNRAHCKSLSEHSGTWAVLLLAFLATASLAAQESSALVQLDYSSFRIISERNVFDANRSGRSAPPVVTDDRRASRVDSFGLVGTIDYGNGPFAFFDGTSDDFRKVLPPGSAIGGLTLATIGDGQVKLQAGTNSFELQVGKQLRREEEGPWQLQEAGGLFARSDSPRPPGDGGAREDEGRRGDSRRDDSRGFDRGRRDDSRSSPGNSSTRSSAPPSTPAVNLTPDQESEILKRLMQQREQELK